MKADSWLFRILEFYGTRLHHRGQWRVLERLRKWLKADIDVDLKVVRDGHKWILNPSDYVQSDFFWLGTRDTWDIFHVKQFLRPGFMIFDVGANFGHYAITLAGALNRNCTVHAFEPFPPNLERLRTNIALNQMEQTIEVHAVGLSDSNGTGLMTTRIDNSGAATLAQTGKDDGHHVMLTTLDAFCLEHRIERLDFMKIDIEGYEEKLLAGGADTFRKHRPLILIELDPPKLLRAGSSVEKLAAQLHHFGYTLHVANRKSLIPLQALPKGDNILNAFCLPRPTQAPAP